MEFLKLKCLLSVLLFYTHLAATSAAECEDPSQLFVIRSVPVGLVLDARHAPAVEIRPFTGSAEQLWRFERSSTAGGFYIINENTGQALDVSDTSTYDIVLSTLDTSSNLQLWYVNQDGTITNGYYSEWNFDLLENNQASGTPLVLYPRSGLSQQIFALQEKS